MKRVLLILLLTINLMASNSMANCSKESIQKAITTVQGTINQLKVASYYGDIKNMTSAYNRTVKYLEPCNKSEKGNASLRYKYACGFACHKELASYQLFLSSSLPNFSEKNNITPASELLKASTDGLEIINSGIELLTSQMDTNTSVNPHWFSQYIRENTELQIVRIRLLMSAGDLFYQKVSEQRIKKLSLSISEVLELTEDKNETIEAKWSIALGYYEQALWTIIEAKTNIPSANDPEFSTILTALIKLENALKRRKESIDKGLLFINIDPEQYTNLNFDKLKNALTTKIERLEKLEAKIKNAVKEGQKNKSAELSSSAVDAKVSDSMKEKVLATKISALQSQMDSAITNEEFKQSNIRVKGDILKTRANVRRVQFKLEQKALALKREIQNIEANTQDRLLAFSKEAQKEKLSALKWSINFSIKMVKLELAINQLEDKIAEYKREIAKNNTKIKLLTIKQTKTNLKKSTINTEVNQSKTEEKKIKKEQNDIFLIKAKIAKAEICDVETELQLLGKGLDENRAYPNFNAGINFTDTNLSQSCQNLDIHYSQADVQQSLCGIDETIDTLVQNEGEELQEHINIATVGLRQTLINIEDNADKFFLKCMVIGDDTKLLTQIQNGTQFATKYGISSERNRESVVDVTDFNCGGFVDSQLSLVTNIYEEEKKYFEGKVENLKAYYQKVFDGVQKMRELYTKFNESVEKAQKKMKEVEKVYNVIANIPKQMIAGLASGVEIDVATIAKRAYELTKEELKRKLKHIKSTITDKEKQEAFKSDLKDIKDKVKEVENRLKAKKMAFLSAKAKIMGKAKKIQNEIEQRMIEARQTFWECQNDNVALTSSITHLLQKHTIKMANFLQLYQEKERLKFDMMQVKSNQKALDLSIAIEDETLSEYRIKLKGLNNDNRAIEKLMDSQKKQIQKLKKVIAKVDDKNRDINHTEADISKIIEQQKVLVGNNSKTQIEALKKALNKTEEQVEEENRDLNQTLQNISDMNMSHQHIFEIKKQYENNITTHKEELLEMQKGHLNAENKRAKAKKRMHLTQNIEVASRFNGIPEFILAKQQILEFSNVLLNTIYKKQRVLSTLCYGSRKNPLNPKNIDEVPYITNANQLEYFTYLFSDTIDLEGCDVVIKNTHFTLDKKSTFVKKLLSKGKVNFEISPFSNNRAFVLWKEDLKDDYSLRLIDFFMVAKYDKFNSECNNKIRYTLTHQGEGYLFENSALFSIVNEKKRNKSHTIHILSQDEINHKLNRYSIETVLADFMNEKNSFEKRLNFLGLPFIGTYSLEVEEIPPKECGWDKVKSLNLHFIYTTKQ